MADAGGQSGHRRLHTPSCLGDSFPCIGSMVDWHIYLYIYHEKSTVHVGKYNYSPMDSYAFFLTDLFFFIRGSLLQPQLVVAKTKDTKMITLVVEPTHLKNMLVKLDHFPKFSGVKIKNAHLTG